MWWCHLAINFTSRTRRPMQHTTDISSQPNQIPWRSRRMLRLVIHIQILVHFLSHGARFAY